MAKTDNFFAEDGIDHRDFGFIPADPTTPKALTPAQVEAFNRDGFLAPLPVFDDAETKRLRARCPTPVDPAAMRSR